MKHIITIWLVIVVLLIAPVTAKDEKTDEKIKNIKKIFKEKSDKVKEAAIKNINSDPETLKEVAKAYNLKLEEGVLLDRVEGGNLVAKSKSSGKKIGVPLENKIEVTISSDGNGKLKDGTTIIPKSKKTAVINPYAPTGVSVKNAGVTNIPAGAVVHLETSSSAKANDGRIITAARTKKGLTIQGKNSKSGVILSVQSLGGFGAVLPVPASKEKLVLYFRGSTDLGPESQTTIGKKSVPTQFWVDDSKQKRFILRGKATGLQYTDDPSSCAKTKCKGFLTVSGAGPDIKVSAIDIADGTLLGPAGKSDKVQWNIVLGKGKVTLDLRDVKPDALHTVSIDKSNGKNIEVLYGSKKDYTKMILDPETKQAKFILAKTGKETEKKPESVIQIALKDDSEKKQTLHRYDPKSENVDLVRDGEKVGTYKRKNNAERTAPKKRVETLEEAKSRILAKLRNENEGRWGLKGIPGIRTRLGEPTEERKQSGIPLPKKPIALTFDACGGRYGSGFDEELVDYLKDNNIPATFFISGDYVRRNKNKVKELIEARDSTGKPLFQIENHGNRHKGLATTPGKVAYGIRGTNSISSAVEEVWGGANELRKLGVNPSMFRSGTAHVTRRGTRVVQETGSQFVGAAILSGDSWKGATVNGILRNYRRAKSGDIILSHMNHPSWNAGEGNIKGIEWLLRNGFTPVRTDEYRLRD